MKVRVRFSTPDLQIDQTFEGATADDVVTQMKSAVAGELGFAVKLMVNAMSPLQFAREVVSRYNETVRKSLPPPSTCQEFIELGQREGIAEILP